MLGCRKGADGDAAVKWDPEKRTINSQNPDTDTQKKDKNVVFSCFQSIRISQQFCRKEFCLQVMVKSQNKKKMPAKNTTTRLES
jgi:hypothetical protein